MDMILTGSIEKVLSYVSALTEIKVLSLALPYSIEAHYYHKWQIMGPTEIIICFTIISIISCDQPS